ncbi:MAG: SusC/RagA family TonB-linked outer membrane protein [Agriterribacter sp.]
MMKSPRCYLLMIVLLLCSTLTLGQAKKTVSGMVTDAEGVGLPGVSIHEKGSKTTGVLSDENGYYSILVANKATLVFSFVGFATQEIVVSSNSTVNVTLSAEDNQLSEVVVTGFGVKKQKRKLTYATQEIKGTELQTAPSPNVLNSLQGKLSGVRIDQGTGGPGSSSRIRIRGNTSLTGNQQPIIVIDGIIIKPDISGPETWADNNNRDQGNILKNLNPDDIESMSVLKGSAASALYGSGAQNGAIIVTTKKGTQKGLGVSLSATEMWDKAYKSPDLQNEYGAGLDPEFTKGADGVNQVDRAGSNWAYNYGPKFDGSLVRDRDDRMIRWLPYDVLDFFQTGRQSNYNLAVQGGSDRSSLRFSYSKNISTGVVPNGNELDRNNFFLRGTQKIGKIFNLDASVTYVNTKTDNPLRQVSNYNPLFRLTFFRPRSLDWNYYLGNYTDVVNGGRIRGADDPYSVGDFLWTTFNNNSYRNESNLRTNIDLTTTITPWLTLLTRGNINYFTVQTEYKYLGSEVGFAGGNYEIQKGDWKNSRIQALLTASKSLGADFDGSFTLGAETNRELGGRTLRSWTDGGLTLPGVFALNNAKNRIASTETYTPTKRTDAIYAYGDITWRNTLTLNFSVRKDYNSTLTYKDGSGTYTFVYPSVGLSYIFTESLKNSSAFHFLSFGKLRASYGETGRDIDAWRLNQVGQYRLGGTVDGVSAGGATITLPIAGFTGNEVVTPNLKNERTKEWEVGADLRFLNNRLGVDIAYYNKNTFNQILALPVPSESGVSSALFNVGQIRNQGVEILLTASPVKTRNFSWDVNLNFTRNRNTVVKLTEGVPSVNLITAFGNDMRAIAMEGRQYGDVISRYAFAYYQKVDAAGKPVDHPSNGKKVIGSPPNGSNGYSFLRSGDYANSLVREPSLGTIMEKFTGGIYNSFRYKEFSLGVQVDAKIGGLMASGTHQYGGSNGSFAYTLPGRDLANGGIQYVDNNGETRYDGIIPDGVFADGIKVTTPAGETVDLGGMSWREAYDKGYMKPKPAWEYYEDLTQWSSGIREYSTFENSWVALREITLGYNLPKSVSSRIKLSNLRINLIGRNLTYLYKTARDGINPEGLSSNNAAAFAEYGGLPFIRSLGFRINAEF